MPTKTCERPSPSTGEGPRDQALQALLEHRLAHLGALAAVRLRLAEELGHLGVAGALGVLDVEVQAQSVAQAGLGVPDEVVVLVGRAGDVAALAGHAAHQAAPRVPTNRTRRWR